MQVTFYNMTSPTIKINKTLGTALGTCSASPNPTGPVDVVNPVLVVDADKVPSNANYIEIGAPLNRKYFIVAVDYTVANTAIITGHSDVLSNFAPTGTMNFVRGAGTLTEMDDASYPISDYMVEEYFPMTTWTDIFSAGGDKRQYLLRTVCSDADTPTYVNLNDNQVFWDSGSVYYDYNNVDPNTGDPHLYYQCYQFNGTRFYTNVPMYVPRQDITGITQVSDGNYVMCNGHAWQWDAGNHRPGSANEPRFYYKGSTT